MDRYTYYFSLGSNIGFRFDYFFKAFERLNSLGFSIEKVSSVYETEPWGGATSKNFFNISVRAKSQIAPEKALFLIKKIEQECGRKDDLLNKPRYSARSLDIDIVYVEGIAVGKEFLQIPHKHAAQRDFVLIPMFEVVMPGSNAQKWLNDALSSFSGNSFILRKIRKIIW